MGAKPASNVLGTLQTSSALRSAAKTAQMLITSNLDLPTLASECLSATRASAPSAVRMYSREPGGSRGVEELAISGRRITSIPWWRVAENVGSRTSARSVQHVIGKKRLH